MKTILLSIISVVLTTPSIVFSQPIDSIKAISKQHKKFDPAADAQKYIQDAVVSAKKLNKRIILDIGGDWCSWCHRLDSLFIQNKDLDNFLIEHYIVVKVNVSKENKNEAVLSKYPKISGYPHVFLLNKEGKLIQSQNTEEWEYPKDSPIKDITRRRFSTFLKSGLNRNLYSQRLL